MFLAALQGSRVCDIDPKGDHRWTELPGDRRPRRGDRALRRPPVAGAARPAARRRRAHPRGPRHQLPRRPAADPVPGHLAHRDPPRRAGRRRPPAGPPGHLPRRRRRAPGGRGATRAPPGRAIETYARGGLARLGFATPERMPPQIAAKQVTSIRIRQLPRPLPGTPKSELSEDERIGQAVLRLMIALAMRILSSDRTRHKVVGFDEAWFLLQEPAGQRLIEHLNRWGALGVRDPDPRHPPARRGRADRQPDRRALHLRPGVRGRGDQGARAAPPRPRRRPARAAAALLPQGPRHVPRLRGPRRADPRRPRPEAARGARHHARWRDRCDRGVIASVAAAGGRR